MLLLVEQGWYSPVTIMITIINFVNDTPLLSFCQERKGVEGLVQEWNAKAL